MSPVLALVLAAAPLKLAAPGLTVINMEDKLGGFYTEHVARELKSAGVDVVTARDIQSVLGLERQKELLGCSSAEGSCLAELANALGTDGVLLGDIAKLSTSWQVNLKIVGAGDGRTLASQGASAKSEEELLTVLSGVARQLARDAASGLGRPIPTGLEKTGPSLRMLAIAPFALGVVAAAAGAVCFALSEGDFAQLDRGTPLAMGMMVRDQGQTLGTLAVVGFSVGGVALAAAVVMFVLGPSSPVTVSAGPNGGVASLRWELP